MKPEKSNRGYDFTQLLATKGRRWLVGPTLGIAATMIASTAVGGCAPPTVDEYQSRGSAAYGQMNAAEDNGGGGGEGLTQTSAAAMGASIDPNTLYMKVDQRGVVYNNAGGGAIVVSVCESDAPAALVDQIKNLNGQPHLVLEKADGSYDTRLSEMPRREENVYYCRGGDYGGTAYIFQLWHEDVGFLRRVDLSGAFINGFSGKHVGCEGGFQLQQGLGLDVKGFRVENGVAQQPEITLTIDGQSTGQAQARCFLKAETGNMVFFAGPVPVIYKLQVLFALQVSVSKATSIHATIGSNGGSLTTDDTTFTITPQIELGVTFYGLVGAYVGADFPVAIIPNPPCSPRVTAGVSFKAGAQAGLLGLGDLPITKALSVEVSTPVLGPFTLAESRCD